MRILAVVGLAGVIAMTTPLVAQQAQGIVPALPGAPQQQAEEQPTGTGLLLGRVLDADSRQPVPAAAVSLRIGRFSVVKLTDAAGRFVFVNVPAGSASLSASKAGYSGGRQGMRRPSASAGPPLVLSDGQRVGDIELPMWRDAVIAGLVVDEAGEPLVRTYVEALLASDVAGRRRFISRPATRVMTDDRGIFRMAGLTPGDYVVQVATTEAAAPLAAVATRIDTDSPLGQQMSFARAPRSRPGISVTVDLGNGLVRNIGGGTTGTIVAGAAASTVYTTTWAPSARAIGDADVISLSSGEVREGVTIQLAPVPASRISGRVTGPEGPAESVAVRLFTAGEPRDTSTTPRATTITGEGGAFTLVGVPAGDYDLSVLRIPRLRQERVSSTFRTAGGTTGIVIVGGPANSSPEPTWWAEVRVSVGDVDVTGLDVALSTGYRLEGQLEFDGEAPERLPTAYVNIEAVDGSEVGEDLSDRRMQSSEDGTFAGAELPAGRYFLRASSPAGWHLKAVMVDGVDASLEPIELGPGGTGNVVVRYSRTTTRLSGQVRSGDGVDGGIASVLVFPRDRTRWTDFGEQPRRFAATRADGTGGYTIAGLPPGAYFVAAVDDAEADLWRVRSVLEHLSRVATEVTLGEAEQRALNLTIVRAR